MSSQGRSPRSGGAPLPVEPPKLSLTFGRALGRVVVTVDGALDGETAPELRDRLVDLIDGQGNRQLVLELGGLTAIDRAGIAVLVDALKRLQRNAGSMVLSGPAEGIVSALGVAGVTSAFAISPAWAHPAYGDGPSNRAGWRRSG
ncbi:MAG TPA: STAS domain-containing protein [Acidimicrobiales bacterium]|nr:STAS domain-containing protein [Acidimicrobiales bacterium]